MFCYSAGKQVIMKIVFKLSWSDELHFQLPSHMGDSRYSEDTNPWLESGPCFACSDLSVWNCRVHLSAEILAYFVYMAVHYVQSEIYRVVRSNLIRCPLETA